MRLHVDTGQFYYANTATGIQQWNNPFNDDIELDDEQEQTEQDIETAIEMLVGNDFLDLKAHSEVVLDDMASSSPRPQSPRL